MNKIEEIIPKSLLITDEYKDKNRGMYFTIASSIYCYDITTIEGNWVQRCTIKITKKKQLEEMSLYLQHLF